jgi:nucleotide-binding universal stress UspA family protein
MFEDILVPLDGSAPGWKALYQAIELARAEGSTLYGLYVVDIRRLSAPAAYLQTPQGLKISPYARSDAELEGWYEKWGQEVLRTMEDTCRRYGVTAIGTLRRGFPEQVICREARRADLVVCGHRPRRGRGASRHGSVLDAVIHKTRTPVLVVSHDTGQLNKILLVYNGRQADSRALNLAARFSLEHRQPLTVMVSGHRPGQYEKSASRLESYFGPRLVKTELVPTNGAAMQTIISTAVKTPVDMIFTPAERHYNFFNGMAGNKLDKLIDKAPCPVLICP